MDNDGQCDFCGDRLTFPAWVYPCDDFELTASVLDPDTFKVEVLKQTYIGAWFACIECYSAIEQGLDALCARSIGGLSRNSEISNPTSQMLEVVKGTNEHFLMYRAGPPVQVYG